jgi:hypothetical protein
MQTERANNDRAVLCGAIGHSSIAISGYELNALTH